MTKFRRDEIISIGDLTSRLPNTNTEYCVKCLDETDISELNIVTGVCCKCSRNTLILTREIIDALPDF